MKASTMPRSPRPMLLDVSAILSAVVALGGCSLGPRPEFPKTSVPVAWNGRAESSAGWPAIDWWRGFGSAELERLIIDAQANNADLAQAKARLRQADAQARIAGAALLPTVALQPAASTIRSLSPTATRRRYSPLLGVASASYEVDLWGKVRDSHRAAQATSEAARLEIDVVRLGVTSSVAVAYFQLRAVQDRIADATGDAASAAHLLAGLRVLQRQGLATGLQVVEQTGVAAQLEAAVPPLEVQRTHMTDALAILTGHTPEEISIVGGSLDEIAIPQVGAGLPSELLLRRPDVQRAERELASASASISVARKSFLPSIALTGTGGVESVALASAIGAPAAIFNLGVSALQPIFAGGRLRGNLDYADGRYMELAAAYVGVSQQAYADTEDALATIAGTKIELGKRADALAAARQALILSKLGLESGVTDQVPLLLAQRELATAHGAYTTVRLNRILGAVALYKALGGGWTTPDGR